jgi:hypothetical protein
MRLRKFGMRLGKLPQKPHLCTRNGGLAQLARALAWHARGHRFDSDILHENEKSRSDERLFSFRSGATMVPVQNGLNAFTNRPLK